jgi:hypothetical protein
VSISAPSLTACKNAPITFTANTNNVCSRHVKCVGRRISKPDVSAFARQFVRH